MVDTFLTDWYMAWIQEDCEFVRALAQRKPSRVSFSRNDIFVASADGPVQQLLIVKRLSCGHERDATKQLE